MKKSTTLFLKVAIVLIGIFVLAMCVLGFPSLLKDLSENPDPLNKYFYGIISIMYITVIPFFIALYQAIKLLNLIDQNKAFSELAVKNLKNIKICAFTISGLYVGAMPFFYLLGELDDAPGAILMGFMFFFAPLVIAFFASVLEKLLQQAIDIKKDNELTI
ncbi:DUF2975 domain-containing protein [Geotoga petraea]|jgi:hypothetical protein|uniref:DUF2975 domain-containing protein n=1 Tax=Geotoga petraea TaxID=28234 RepID=A0A4Z0VUL8_9BACT|nr:DUF2975 domain-containing protein [Geotoga petraea]TGG87516.1 DUF2975 domain-containing protein [Geotoga petraea]